MQQYHTALHRPIAALRADASNNLSFVTEKGDFLMHCDFIRGVKFVDLRL
jgi:hypothetical protein